MTIYNRCFFIISLLLLVTTTIRPGVTQDTDEKPTLAVMDFQIGPSVARKKEIYSSRFGRRKKEESVSLETSLFTNKLITEFTKTNRVSVVEREQLNQLMKESDLSRMEYTDPQHSVEIGKILGADYMLFGTISLLDGEVSTESVPFTDRKRKTIHFVVGADIRITNSETGEIEAAETLKATGKKTIREDSDFLMSEFQNKIYNKLVGKIAKRTMNTLFPIRVAQFANNTVYLNRGNLEKGSQYEVVQLGEKIKDPATGKVLGRSEKKVARIKITEGMNKMSKASVIEWFTDESKQIPDGSICRVIGENSEDDSEGDK